MLYDRLNIIKREVWFPRSLGVSTQFYDQIGSSTCGQNLAEYFQVQTANLENLLQVNFIDKMSVYVSIEERLQISGSGVWAMLISGKCEFLL